MTFETWGKTQAGEGGPVADVFLTRPETGLFVIADGSGEDGAVAAQVAVQALEASLESESELARVIGDRARAIQELPAVIDRALQRASEKVHSRTGCAPGGASMTALLLGEERGVIGHAGDTRLYVLRDGQLHVLTDDHTFRTARLHTAGLPAPSADAAEAATLTRAVGALARVEADCLPFARLPGDIYLLCTDGLYKHLRDEELIELLGGRQLADVPERLIALARQRGSRDDCTAVVIRPVVPDAKNAEQASARTMKALAKLELFGSLTPTEVVRLLGRFDERNLRAGEVLIKEDTEGHEMFVIVEGRVELRAKGRLLRYLEAGNHVGEFALIDNQRRSATVTATEPTRLLVMTARGFDGLKREEPARAVSFYEAIARRLSLSLREASEFLVRFY